MKIKTILTNQFIRGGLIVLIASNISNLSQFVFHFLTGRFLGKVFYGDLAAIISILGIISIVQMALGLTVVKLIAVEHPKKTSNIVKWIDYYGIIIGFILAAVFLILSPVISRFLNLSSTWSIYFLVPLILLYIITGTERSILQGLLDFNKYALSFLSESVAKIIILIIFLVIGWQILGALGAMVLGILVSFIFTRISLSSHLKGKREEGPKANTFLKYSSLTFIQGLSLTSMYTSDLILVKHFFSAESAGIYASLAILGRIVFFGANPIVNVMFPTIARRHNLNQKYYNIFYLSLGMVSLTALSITTVYYFIPQLPIEVLYGKSYLLGAPYLWWYGIFMTSLAISMLLTQFYLSINKQKIIYMFPAFALLQIILISFFHQNILQVIQVSILASTLLNLSLLVYFFYQKRRI